MAEQQEVFVKLTTEEALLHKGLEQDEETAFKRHQELKSRF